MPELPEVETLLRQLKKTVCGRVIREVRIFDARVLNVDPAVFQAGLRGETAVSLSRKGKYLGLETASAKRLWFHLGMTGRLLAAEESRLKHTHLALSFEGGRSLFFSDPRRFGRVIFLDRGGLEPAGLAATAPDPFEMSEDVFARLFQGRTAPIKSLLLNQRLVSGIGNIYADEGLFRAAIFPARRVSRLARAKLIELHRALRQVLSEAVAAGGSSIDDYRHVDGRKGSFQEKHRVYGRTGLPCTACGTAIRVRRTAGRSTHYCPGCQK